MASLQVIERSLRELKLEQKTYTFAQLLKDVDALAMPKNWVHMKYKNEFIMFVELAPPNYFEGKKIVVINSMDVKFFNEGKPVPWISCEEVGSKHELEYILDVYNSILSLE
ncbi:hypothetical protein PV328_010458 [Microctonus aethiopoides]|uniref:Uncharacterized protein n=1 Tax=Microctonus aethiopoides TaxID=144406 RepID=A0AA39FI04_9HYME|nr:hypothetical protein PV328_010458 [Microctonus aethiopoides]